MTNFKIKVLIENKNVFVNGKSDAMCQKSRVETWIQVNKILTSEQSDFECNKTGTLDF